MVKKAKEKKIKVLKVRKEKKPRKAKPVYNDIIFDSQLEIYCYKKLIEAKIEFDYHPKSFELFNKFTADINSWTPDKRKGDLVYQRTGKYQNISYTPDFIGDGWIIETKGLLDSHDALVLKLFKRHLSLVKHDYKDFYMPSNHKQVDAVIQNILKNK
jgi:hypothetical protein